MADTSGGTWKGLDHEEDERIIRRDWRFERVARIVFGVLLLAAVAGAFGAGPLARASADAGALHLDYTRIERRSAAAQLHVRLPPAAVGDTVIALWLDRRWVAGVRIDRVAPEPRQARDDGDAIIYEFEATPGRAAHIRFDYQHDGQGMRRGSAGIVHGDSVRFAQFVFP